MPVELGEGGQHVVLDARCSRGHCVCDGQTRASSGVPNGVGLQVDGRDQQGLRRDDDLVGKLMLAGLVVKTGDVVDCTANRRAQPQFLAELFVGLLECGTEDISPGEITVAEFVVLEVGKGRNRLEVVIANAPIQGQNDCLGLVFTEVTVRGAHVIPHDICESGVRCLAG